MFYFISRYFAHRMQSINEQQQQEKQFEQMWLEHKNNESFGEL